MAGAAVKQEPTFAEKVAAITTTTELEGMKYGLQIEAETLKTEIDRRKLNLIELRRAEIQRERGMRQ